ncbi:MAG: hypothetical protein GF308_05540 [Candidatus Heimdallarchaeota archaeon]|nr:hypothetical protein [Candidatus Heimdallarchaeota archaeon]
MNQDTISNKKWFSVPAEREVIKMPGPVERVGPKHPLWQKRILLEVKNIEKYLNFIMKSGGRPWFKLAPSTKKEDNFMIWKGLLNVATRPEIKFDIVVLLPATYPTDCPRALIDEIVLKKYKCSKIYTENKYTDPKTGKNFVMICHDHMKKVGEVWTPDLSIAHFFIREIHTWWSAQQNAIITEWDLAHQKS